MTSSQTALITGASHGIGFALAKQFAAHGYTLILVSRDKYALEEKASQLKEMYGVQIHVLSKDLSVPEAAQDVYQFCIEHALHIDILVNNAGFGTYGPFSASSITEAEQMIHLNIIALTSLTRLFLPGMIEKKHGNILQVASMAAFEPGPYMAVYFATKAYVLSFGEALYQELKHTGVTVTTLCPGPTQTNFSTRANAEKAKMFYEKKLPSADDVALVGYTALTRGKRLVIPGVKNRLLVFLIRLMPRAIVLSIIASMQRE